MAEFVNVAGIDEILPGHAKLVEVNGSEIAIFNIDGSYHALDNSCSHVGGPLCEGEILGCQVTCPWHGAIFDVRSGAALGPPAFESVASYPVRIAGSQIQIEIQ